MAFHLPRSLLPNEANVDHSGTVQLCKGRLPDEAIQPARIADISGGVGVIVASSVTRRWDQRAMIFPPPGRST